jgi:hypothetical protein
VREPPESVTGKVPPAPVTVQVPCCWTGSPLEVETIVAESRAPWASLTIWSIPDRSNIVSG